MHAGDTTIVADPNIHRIWISPCNWSIKTTLTEEQSRVAHPEPRWPKGYHAQCLRAGSQIPYSQIAN